LQLSDEDLSGKQPASAAASAAGISKYSSLDEKIARMRKTKRRANDCDNYDSDDVADDADADAMDVDDDTASADEHPIKQGLL